MSDEWVVFEGNIATIGLKQSVVNEIGDIVFIQLPETKRVIKQDEEIAILESTKAAIDLYCPLNGIVIAINELLLKSPNLLNEDSEGAGWLYKIEV